MCKHSCRRYMAAKQFNAFFQHWVINRQRGLVFTILCVFLVHLGANFGTCRSQSQCNSNFNLPAICFPSTNFLYLIDIYIYISSTPINVHTHSRICYVWGLVNKHSSIPANLEYYMRVRLVKYTIMLCILQMNIIMYACSSLYIYYNYKTEQKMDTYIPLSRNELLSYTQIEHLNALKDTNKYTRI